MANTARQASPPRHGAWAQRGRIAPFLPWSDGTGRPWRGVARLPGMIPFVLLYIVLSWVLFIPAAEKENGKYSIDEDAVDNLIFHIPDLTTGFLVTRFVLPPLRRIPPLAARASSSVGHLPMDRD